MSERPAILFVCLGNICRSPLAEAAFRKAAEDVGLDFELESAGTGDWHVGKGPDPRALAVAKRNGLDISSKRARQLEDRDYYRFTHIYALDRGNLNAIRLRAPADATARIALLLDSVDGRRGESVADPYFGEDADFDVTWADVEAAAAALVRHFKR